MTFVGEIRIFAGNYAPVGWAFCDGQLLPISENETLFQLIGTTYGGDGQTTFALPDLRGRLPVHQASGYTLGSRGGLEEVTLTVQQLPSHTHRMRGTASTATGTSPDSTVLAASTGATTSPYGTDQPHTLLAAQAIGPRGGSQPHSNLQPYLVVNFIISLFGLFPPPT